MNEQPEPSWIDPPDHTWWLAALCDDRRDLTREIIVFLVSREAEGYSPDTIARVLGPIFGLYVRDHLLSGRQGPSMRRDILEGLPKIMAPELIDEFAVHLGYSSRTDKKRGVT